MLSAVIRDERTGSVVGILQMDEKTFASGRVGFYGQGKAIIDGERYQCQAQAVRIVPKGEEVPSGD